IDSALTRKGRLIAKYEFGKLNTDKAQKLSDHLGFKQSITEPMTVAEITNPHEKQQQAKKVEVIGFKRQGMLLN
ncbi:MAG: AAA family ATPase, partial [Chitinophagaceae bacterium]